MSKTSAFLVVVFTILMTTNYLCYTSYAQECEPSSTLVGKQPPSGACDPEGATCCEAGGSYEVYTCSPPVTSTTSAVLTLNSFEEGGDGGGASSCDGSFHSNETPVVALSTGWYNDGSRCGKQITIQGNGRTTTATVVDQCDSTKGCDEEHGYQVPCRPNVVDASNAVWKALGASESDGEISITWSDA